MPNQPLNIIATDNRQPQPRAASRRTEAQAQYEKRWLDDPNQFSPSRNCMEKERIERTIALIKNHLPYSNHEAVDLGCGMGILTEKIFDLGFKITAVDIAGQPLKALRDRGIETKQDYVPKTLLEDSRFGLVVAADLIAEIPPTEYRLFFAEMARLLAKEGRVVCSTSIDIYSENALQRFAELAETEFVIEEWVFSYHCIFIRLNNSLKAPARFSSGWRSPVEREKGLGSRQGLSKIWYNLNSSRFLGPIWFAVNFLTSPIVKMLSHSPSLLRSLEKLSRLIWQEEAISHAIFIGKQRPLIPKSMDSMQPKEIKHKKQLWE